MKVHIQKQMIPVKSRHLLLLFYKISIPIYAFLPALQNLKYASMVEVRSSSSQPASHGFLDCLVSPVMVTSQGPEQVVVWGGQIRTVGWIGKQFPAFLLNCLQGQTCNVRPREQTFRYLKISIISWTAWWPTPSCAAVSLTVILRSCLMIVDFLLVALSCSGSLLTTARLIGDVRVSVLKMFHSPSDTAGTHVHHEVARRWVLPSFPPSQEIQWQLVNEKTCRCDSHFLAVHDGNVRGADALILRSCWRGKMRLMIL
jgi:hypothetical protein